MKTLLILTALMTFPIGLAGCGQTYEGSGDFYDQHPEYHGRPDYYAPNSDNDDSTSHTSFFGVGHTDDDK